MYYKYRKVYIKSQAVRAGSVRPRGLAGRIKPPKSVRRFTVARFEYVPKPGQNLLPLVKYAPKRGIRPLRGLQNQKKGAKKGRKKGMAGQNLRLSRSVRFMRPECGGGVCQPGGWLGCTLFACSVPEAVGETRGLPSMYTFCRQNCRMVSG